MTDFQQNKLLLGNTQLSQFYLAKGKNWILMGNSYKVHGE